MKINPLNVLKGLGASFVITVSLVVMFVSLNVNFDNSNAGLPAALTGESGGNIIVSLSPSNPPSTTIIAGQFLAHFLELTFSGTGNVNSMTLRRLGVSSQYTLSRIYLFDGLTYLADGVLDQNSVVVFNNLDIIVNGEKKISIMADVSLGTTGQTVGLSLTQFVSGLLLQNTNIFGNLMSIANVDIPKVIFSKNTVNSSSVFAGKQDVKFWSAPILVETDLVYMSNLWLKLDGTVRTEDLVNLRLLLDGKDFGTLGTIINKNGSRYVEFKFSKFADFIEQGEHTLSMNADIKTNAKNGTVQISLYRYTDVSVNYPKYKIYIQSSGIIPNKAGIIRIISKTPDHPDTVKTEN